MAWTGTVLACTTSSEHTFTLTFYAEGRMWTADDPQQLLETGAGDYRATYSALDVLATGCFYENRELVQVAADVTTLAKDAQGIGSIAGSEDFVWVCVAVFD